jgi:hypothetical protein
VECYTEEVGWLIVELEKERSLIEETLEWSGVAVGDVVEWNGTETNRW